MAASTRMARFRQLKGVLLTELICTSGVSFLNVVITEVGRQYIVVTQEGSGGAGTFVVNIDNVVAANM
ncbi:hypothetical protein QUF84_11520 [Fictibacillus enclensis]|uniref:hypothetical protein n=1 Tax=Fictibacillus enclensis TaxID=1017270 RepID=UPI0024C00465|nr:hypothetical protein [Fictibacillus enclensis]MDM5337850.1 hypothetical protein [Fictibacillus enclensis]WHY74211.1 hypothetical protein QNH15_09995 [Fictibacillus enclensis]